jgi:hypothetical protein
MDVENFARRDTAAWCSQSPATAAEGLRVEGYGWIVRRNPDAALACSATLAAATDHADLVRSTRSARSVFQRLSPPGFSISTRSVPAMRF